MASAESPETVPVTSGGPAVEVGQLPDDRQFVAAIQRVNGGWMAVVHFFSPEGEHVDTEHSAILEAGGDAAPEAIEGELERMLRRLEPYRGDTATVTEFEIEVAGHRIGLAPEREGGGMRLEPSGPILPRAPGP